MGCAPVASEGPGLGAAARRAPTAWSLTPPLRRPANPWLPGAFGDLAVVRLARACVATAATIGAGFRLARPCTIGDLGVVGESEAS